MVGVLVRTEIDAPRDVVWRDLASIADHVSWMEDAVAIRFTSAQTSGVGTAFDCETRVGPLHVTDRMEVTEWREGEAMGVRHVGVVSGTGAFTLAPTPDGRTVLTWDERLRFPWWLGGSLGEVAGAWVLRRIWRRNLDAFRSRWSSPRRR